MPLNTPNTGTASEASVDTPIGAMSAILIPRPLAEDERDDDVVDDAERGPERELPEGERALLDEERAREERYAAEHHLPGGEGRCRHRDRQPFHEDRPDRPGDGRSDHERRAERRAAQRMHLAEEEQTEAAHARGHAEQASRPERLAEHECPEDHAPHGHRIAEDRRPARLEHRDRVDGEDVPSRHVEERDDGEARPGAGRDAEREPVGARDGEQARGAAVEAQRPEVERRHLAEDDLHDRPVQSPTQGQRREQRDRLRRQRRGRRRQARTDLRGQAGVGASAGRSAAATSSGRTMANRSSSSRCR